MKKKNEKVILEIEHTPTLKIDAAKNNTFPKNVWAIKILEISKTENTAMQKFMLPERHGLCFYSSHVHQHRT